LHQDFGGITASMAPTIAGVNPWDSSYALWLRLMGETPPVEQSFAMWLGSQMEGIIIRAFTRETKLKVRRPRKAADPSFFFTTEEYGFPMGALLDGWTIEDGDEVGIEAKHASSFAGDDWADEPPLHYFLQVQHQMACTGWHKFYAVALVGKKLVYLPVARDDEIIAMLTDRERSFWLDNVVARVPPPVDGSQATSEALKARYGHSEPGFSVLIEDAEVERLCASYLANGRAIDALKTEREGVKNRLLTILESAESAVIGKYKVTAKEQTRTTVDIEALRKDEPKLVAKYEKTATSRPLRVTERKGDA
jgi:putative phage-type endonuclease